MGINVVISLLGSANLERPINKVATLENLRDLTTYAEIVSIEYLQFHGSFVKKNTGLITLQGEIKSKIYQQCALSSLIVESVLVIKFKRIYSLKEIKNYNKEINFSLEDEEVQYIENGKINLQDLIAEELILNINPFIKHPSVEL